MAPSNSAPLAHSKSVVFADLGEETVILDTESGKYYELDSVGARIWALLEDKPTMAELRDKLTDEFDVDGETLLKDLSDFLGTLGGYGLIAAACEETGDA